MPAAKKRTATKKATPKTRAKSNVKSSVAKAPQLNWAVVGVVAAILVLIGTLFVLFSQAGTTVNYKTTDGSIVPRRFPGDPNPRVSKKAYWGADKLDNTSYEARFENVTGKSMSTVRRFYSSWGQRGSLPAQAKADIGLNRLPMYSIKPEGWVDMATSSARQIEIDTMLKNLDAAAIEANGPVWLIIHHEPDGGGGCKCGPRKEDDPSGAAGWVKMQQKFRERMTAMGTKNIALMAAMTGGWGSDFHQPKDNWWPGDGVLDAWFIDHYKDTLDSSVASKADWAEFSTWADAKKVPYGTAELGIRSGGAEGVGYFKPVPDGPDADDDNQDECKAPDALVPRGVSAANDQKSGERLREFWNWGFENNKDVIAHAYFDKCINSGDSPFAMGGAQLDVFRDILKNDSRVQRVKELGTPTTSTPTPTPTTTTTVTPTTTSTPVPTVSMNIVGLTEGQVVTTTINVEAQVSNAGSFKQVDFYIDNTLAKTEKVAKYCIGGGDVSCNDYSVTGLSTGAHSLKVVLRYGDAQTITKTIGFSKSSTASSDITKPSAPTNVKASIGFDPLSFSYSTNLSWAPSFDSGSGIKDYLVRRNGTDLGATVGLSYKDGSIVANTLYSYEVFARDNAGNVSAPGTARLTGRCFLVWCWAE